MAFRRRSHNFWNLSGEPRAAAGLAGAQGTVTRFATGREPERSLRPSADRRQNDGLHCREQGRRAIRCADEAWLQNASDGKRERLAFICDLLGLELPLPDAIRYHSAPRRIGSHRGPPFQDGLGRYDRALLLAGASMVRGFRRICRTLRRRGRAGATGMPPTIGDPATLCRVGYR